MANLSPHELQSMGSALLIEAFLEAVTERALLTYDDAPDAELKEVQHKIDMIQEQLLRRMSW